MVHSLMSLIPPDAGASCTQVFQGDLLVDDRRRSNQFTIDEDLRTNIGGDGDLGWNYIVDFGGRLFGGVIRTSSTS